MISSLDETGQLVKVESTIQNDDGGKLSLNNEVEVAIAAGSLQSDSENISIQRKGGAANQGRIVPVSSEFEFGPNGIQFVGKTTAKFCYDRKLITNRGLQERTLQVYYRDPDTDRLESIGGTVNSATGCVIANLEHFSNYVLAAYDLKNITGNNPPAVTGVTWLPATPIAGIPLRIRALITDFDPQHTQGAIAAAVLKYRIVGEATGATFPRQLALQPDPADVTGQFFYGVIPAAAVTTSDIEYRLEVTDNLGTPTHLPSTTPTAFTSRSVNLTMNAGTKLRFATATLRIAAGFSKDFVLQAHDSANNWQNIEGDSFSVSNSLGTVNRVLTGSIRFLATGDGTGVLTGNSGIYSTTAALEVRMGAINRIELLDKATGVIIASPVYLIRNQIYPFDAVGFDQYNNQMPIIPQFGVTGSIGSIDSLGSFTAVNSAPLTGTVTITLAGFNDTVPVYVDFATFNVSGTVTGLTGTVVLKNNGGDDITRVANGGFTFPALIADTSPYNVTVGTQPIGQLCTVTNAAGTIPGANVTNVSINCVASQHTISGTVGGIAATGLVLQNNGGDNIAVNSNGAFNFPASITYGSNYSVAILTQPAGQICKVANNTGIITANVTNVLISCTTPAWTEVEYSGGLPTGYGVNRDTGRAGQFPSLASYNGKLYATWREFNNSGMLQIRVGVYSGNDQFPYWRRVDGDQEPGLNFFTQYDALLSRLIVFNGKLYIIWYEWYCMRMAVYNGNDNAPTWTLVDGAQPNRGIESVPYYTAWMGDAFVFDSKLYISWHQWATTNPRRAYIRVGVYNGNDQAPGFSIVDGAAAEGLNYSADYAASGPKFTSINSKLYVFWSESNSTGAYQLRGKVYNGNDAAPAWTSVDGNGTTGINYNTNQHTSSVSPSVHNGKIYLAWSETPVSPWQPRVRVSVYNGNDGSPAWSFTDGNGPNGAAYLPGSVARDPELITFSSKLFMTWSERSATGIDQIRIAVYNDNDGTPSWGLVDGNQATGIGVSPTFPGQNPHMAVFDSKLYITWWQQVQAGGQTQARVAVGSNLP